MGQFKCVECDKIVTFDVIPRRGFICFKCHVSTVNLGFVYGREDFHGPTIKERQDLQMAQSNAAGIRAEPIGERWI